MRHLRSGAFVLCLAILPAGLLEADVKTEEKSQVKFEGMMGRMMGLFGGKAMKEGTVNTAAVKGNRKMTVSEYTGNARNSVESSDSLVTHSTTPFSA